MPEFTRAWLENKRRRLRGMGEGLTSVEQNELLQWALEALEQLERVERVDWIAGEIMVCENHIWRLWPDGDEGCPGPGMPLSSGEGRIRLLEAKKRRLREALENLYDVQNGPPLPQDVENGLRAMQQAQALLIEEVKP